MTTSALGAFVGSSALYMGLHPRLGGIVYGFELFLNGVFFLAAASIAYYAIRLGNVQVHKDWMIRTYILACAGIVGDRIIPDMTFVARRIGVGALNDTSGWATMPPGRTSATISSKTHSGSGIYQHQTGMSQIERIAWQGSCFSICLNNLDISKIAVGNKISR